LAEAPAEPVEIEQLSLAPSENHINDVNGKIKHIFGGAKQTTAKLDERTDSEPAAIDKATEELQPVFVESNIEAVQTETVQAEPARQTPQPLEDKTAPKLTGKFKHMFGNAMQQIAKLDEKLTGETAPANKSAEEPQPVLMEDVRSDIQPESPSKEHQPSDAVKARADSVSGKVKNLFGTLKSATEAPQPAQTKQAEPETLAELAARQQNNQANGTGGENKKIPTQLKSLFSKFQPRA